MKDWMPSGHLLELTPSSSELPGESGMRSGLVQDWRGCNCLLGLNFNGSLKIYLEVYTPYRPLLYMENQGLCKCHNLSVLPMNVDLGQIWLKTSHIKTNENVLIGERNPHQNQTRRRWSQESAQAACQEPAIQPEPR